MYYGASRRSGLSSRNIDRLVLIGLYRLAPNVLDALKILKPATVIAWHRAGFRAYWHWKSRPQNDVRFNVGCRGLSGLVMLMLSFVGHGRVEMWRGGCRSNISVVRLFRLAVP